MATRKKVSSAPLQWVLKRGRWEVEHGAVTASVRKVRKLHARDSRPPVYRWEVRGGKHGAAIVVTNVVTSVDAAQGEAQTWIARVQRAHDALMADPS